MIDGLRRHVAGTENLSEREIDRRVSLYYIQCDALERRLAATWRKVVVTKMSGDTVKAALHAPVQLVETRHHRRRRVGD
jgi:hypothetical protein